MVHFEAVGSYARYSIDVSANLRYHRTAETDRFLQAVLITASKREQTIKSGAILWRAQFGSIWEQVKGMEKGWFVPRPHPNERMKPIANRCVEGRANSKGLPVLYLATEQDTAMREVRPALASFISIAEFEVKRDL